MNVLLLLGVLVPQQVLIATPRGQVSIPVMNEQGAAAVAAVLLTQPLGLTVSLDGSAAHVTLGDHSFDFDVGSPFVRYEGAAYPLVGAPYVARDTLFLPLHWLTDHLPRLLAGRYRWDPWLARLDERPVLPAPPPVASAAPPQPIAAPNPITGLRLVHTIVVDPGHGGVDPGNPGLHFPRGRRQSLVNGVETYFVSDAKTEDQKRVAQMENDALRFETAPGLDGGGSVGFILHDLQLNEYLRESARLAELVQGKVAGIHPGEDRGVQQGPFLVLAAARRPAILVEAGFATNRTDGAFLASSQGQHKIASAIAEGIVAYLLEFERKLAVGSGGGQAR